MKEKPEDGCITLEEMANKLGMDVDELTRKLIAEGYLEPAREPEFPLEVVLLKLSSLTSAATKQLLEEAGAFNSEPSMDEILTTLIKVGLHLLKAGSNAAPEKDPRNVMV